MGDLAMFDTKSDEPTITTHRHRRWPWSRYFLFSITGFGGLFLFLVCLTTQFDLYGGVKQLYSQKFRAAEEGIVGGEGSKCPFHRFNNHHPPEPQIQASTFHDLLKRDTPDTVTIPPSIESLLSQIQALPTPSPGDPLYNSQDISPKDILAGAGWNKNQKIDLTGVHKFVPPKKGDLRGPCPGLNALANHGYLPHSGVVGLLQIVGVVNEIFGMGVDLGLLLTVYSTVLVGDPLSLSWSIGGPATTLLGFLLGTGKGLSGSHNMYESDASLVAGDSYLHNGDSDTFQEYRFKQLMSLQEGIAFPNYCNLDLMANHRNWTINHSIANNPHFFFGPFSGLLVSTAGHTFVPAFMCNFTKEYPRGILNEEMLMDWWAFDRDPANPGRYKTRGKGWSTFPRDWHRRPIGVLYDYGLLAFSLDLVAIALKVPGALKIGGNTGTVNSFTGIDLGNLTGGLFNTIDLLTDPKKLICFLLQLLSVALPGILRKDGLLGGLLKPALDLITKLITVPLLDPTCPRLGIWDDDILHQFPGAGTD
ncbi:hypothetical protein DFH27DRAFT_388292 [Peziza echinospora]|nr:hypothetical protein DFH27DRAFT_388292 [Peziza echinospora]